MDTDAAPRGGRPELPVVPSLLWPARHGAATALTMASLAAAAAATALWSPPVLEALTGGDPFGDGAGEVAALCLVLSAVSVGALLGLVRVLGPQSRAWLTAHRWLLGLFGALGAPVAALLFGPLAAGRVEPTWGPGTAASVAIGLTLAAPSAALAVAHVTVGRSGPAGRREWVLACAGYVGLWSTALAVVTLA